MKRTITITLSQVGEKVSATASVDPHISWEDRGTTEIERVARALLSKLAMDFDIVAEKL